jgi:hypothetical protein
MPRIRTLLFAVVSIASVLGTSGSALAATAGDPPVVQPNVIASICDQKGNGNCIQASGGVGGAVTAQAFSGNPNQEFNLFVPGPGSTACGDNISDTNCPFPGVTPGEQIAVIGGQDAENSGACVAFTSLRTQGHLAPCNGGTGTIFVIDGYSLENAYVSRNNGGGKMYMEENPNNLPTIRTAWVSGISQWTQH